ncbi:hypothetical protein CDD83_9465 [Cordyceps sp. RAO-2017]|nr:hypothetical protein CDD83_9465 [Cordyceps sp. RAO-2017]
MPARPRPTHFLCIPLCDAQLARSWASFRADVTAAPTSPLPDDAVRPLGTLHLTLGVMALPEPRDVGRAVQVLRSLRPRATLAALRAASAAAPPLALPDGVKSAARPPPVPANADLLITLRGLRSMQAASKASVLYVPPSDPEGLLYRLCQQLREPFFEAGLMEDEGRPLLLHATVVNTIYAKRAAHGRRRERLLVDARDLLARYDDYVWAGASPVAKLALCKMGATTVEGSDGDEAYEVEAERDI